MIIDKYEGSMSSRERVLCAMQHGTPDRVPINYLTNVAVYERLASALDIQKGDYEGVLKALGVDFRSVEPVYTGPVLFNVPTGRKVDSVYGFVTRWIANKDGGYWDYCDFPLKDAISEVIASFPIPNPDNFDYETAIEKIKRYSAEGYAVSIGNAGIADIINSTGRVMGMEDTLVNLMFEDDATLTYIDRRCAMELGVLGRLLDKANEHVTFVWMGEDLGTQKAPMISLDLYRSVIRPRHQKYIDLAKFYDKPVMMHSCGSSSWAFPDFIEMGVDVVDTLQPEAENMSPIYLKKTFGKRLSFHGCVSTAGPLAYGNAKETEDSVREILEIMMPGGGYLLSPTHAIQDNTPVENIIAMYNAAHKFGRY